MNTPLSDARAKISFILKVILVKHSFYLVGLRRDAIIVSDAYDSAFRPS